MIRIAALLSVLLLVQDDKGEAYYKFKKGTTWTYDAEEGAEMEKKKTKVVFTIIGEDAGKIKMEMKEYKEDQKEPDTQEFVAYVEKGLLMWGMSKEGGDVPPVPILKIGSKKGDTWSTTMGGEDQKLEVKGSHEGTEEVKVAAGTYKDAIHTKVDIGGAIVIEFWLVAKVGIVKIKVGDEAKVELKEFVEGK